MSKTTAKEMLTVKATGRVAPYGIGESIEDITATKRAITAAIKAGHKVVDASGYRVEVVDGKIERF